MLFSHLTLRSGTEFKKLKRLSVFFHFHWSHAFEWVIIPSFKTDVSYQILVSTCCCHHWHTHLRQRLMSGERVNQRRLYIQTRLRSPRGLLVGSPAPGSCWSVDHLEWALWWVPLKWSSTSLLCEHVRPLIKMITREEIHHRTPQSCFWIEWNLEQMPTWIEL